MAKGIKAVAEIKDDEVYILQAGTKVFVKTADICAMTGKSNQWVGQLTSQGVINKQQTSHGALYDLSRTVKAYCDMLESRGSDKDEKDKEIEQQKSKADASYKQAKATMATLSAKELLGKMHRSEDVAAMTEDLVYTIRGALLALPGRLAVDVIAAADAAEASEIIRKEVYKIMEELSNYQYSAAKYEERVRERLNMSSLNTEDEED